MKIAMGNDHAAVEMKKELLRYLEEKGIEVINVGTDTAERYDYPLAGFQVARCSVSAQESLAWNWQR